MPYERMKLSKSVRKEVDYIEDLYTDIFKSLDMKLLEAKSEEISFGNKRTNFTFIFDVNRYNPDYLNFEKLMISTSEKEKSTKDLISRTVPSLDFEKYIDDNLQEFIPRHNSYKMLIEKYLLDQLKIANKNHSKKK